MRKTIRLTEADLSRLIRRIIREGNEGEILTCLMKATGMRIEELIKLAPCSQLQQDPTNTTNIQACISAVIPVATAILTREVFSDPFGVPKKILDMTTKCIACGTKGGTMESRRMR